MPRRTAKVWYAVGILMLLMVMLGCSTTQERYKVLSFFFDGVPNPDTPKVKVQAVDPNAHVITASIISRHKPFVEDKCASCHRTESGNIMEFEEAYKLCTNCHKDTPTKYPRMHGPVALASCQWCHTAHESIYPALLKDPSIQVCTQCHDSQLLGNKPPEHLDGKTSCLDCHAGHGGPERYFLHPRPATQPATAPSTQPSTAPSTGPAVPTSSPARQQDTRPPEQGRAP